MLVESQHKETLLNEFTKLNCQHPLYKLEELANKWDLDVYSEEFAKELDNRNVWPCLRDRFYYPKLKDLPNVDLSLVDNPDDECIYFESNGLGLQPKSTQKYINIELEKWAKMGSLGFVSGDNPWTTCDEPLRPAMARLAGALIDEVAIMNFLTVNLHLLMISFYQPTETRYKILFEEKAFPSDHYIVQSQIRLNGLDKEKCMIRMKPREGEYTLRTDDILSTIEKEGDRIAVVFLPGIQYLTGQYFEIEKITKAAHAKGCLIGWDLAHAIGNVELKLHDWQVDFAAWCTYKYLNSGAGSMGALYVHEKHFNRPVDETRRLEGWWGHRLETRFKMTNIMEPCYGANAYHLSNGSMLLACCLKSSLEIFDEVGIKTLREKSKHLTAYLEAYLKKLRDEENIDFEFITPTNPDERGAQISLKFKANAFEIYNELEKRGVMCSCREPGIIRFAPTPLFNTFSEVNRLIKLFKQSLLSVKNDKK